MNGTIEYTFLSLNVAWSKISTVNCEILTVFKERGGLCHGDRSKETLGFVELIYIIG